MLKMKFVVFPSKWSLYTWLTGWHVNITTQHAGQHFTLTNREIGRRDEFDGRLLNSGTNLIFR